MKQIDSAGDSPDSSGKRKTRGPGKKTISRLSTMGLDVVRQKTSSNAKVTCKCAKTKCLKMYCECFTIGRFCDPSCKCVDCRNTPEFEDQIRKARKSIRTRNPLAFKPKVMNNTGSYNLFK